MTEHRLKTKFYGITKGENGLLSTTDSLMLISPEKHKIQAICNWLNLNRPFKHEVVPVYCIMEDQL